MAQRHAIGSIPACAGEPPWPNLRHCPRRVYPRVCGGTWPSRTTNAYLWGLSPRVRGNRPARVRIICWMRSIPACAGEPGRARVSRHTSEVYPRVCGGTAAAAAHSRLAVGLSPRVRGNLFGGCGRRHRRGSIPACAGEPLASLVFSSSSEVYPRVCGGTEQAFAGIARAEGLSPRVRGNHWPLQGRPACPGSIPACAGEPAASARCPAICRVYPRVCGGTHR